MDVLLLLLLGGELLVGEWAGSLLFESFSPFFFTWELSPAEPPQYVAFQLPHLLTPFLETHTRLLETPDGNSGALNLIFSFFSCGRLRLFSPLVLHHDVNGERSPRR